jgi:hypothetical protein
MNKRLVPLMILVPLVAVLAGCRTGRPPAGPPVATPYTTQGKVSFPDGSALRGGVVVFTPVEIKTGSKMRYEGAGLINDKGEYKIGLNGDGTGVPAGDYKVTILPRDYQELKGSNSARIPNQYREASTTPLTLTVKEQDNTFDLVLR